MCHHLFAIIHHLTAITFHKELFKKNCLQNIALEKAAWELCYHVPMFMHACLFSVAIRKVRHSTISASAISDVSIYLQTENNSLNKLLIVVCLFRSIQASEQCGCAK